MAALLPCPPWEYKDHPNYQSILRAELAVLLRALRLGNVAIEVEGVETRPVHQRLFARLTPSGHPYFAGHYRGEHFLCLIDYNVSVPGDPVVGVHYTGVQAAMERFGETLLTAAAVLDQSFALPNATLSQEQKLYSAVVVAARAFQEFLTVHPYANGNGHIARFLVWLLLGRYGYWPSNWTIDPRPNITNYAEAISYHRRGDTVPLEHLILQSIL
jgi:fido (protein-threonine AMPylation protein)